MNNRIDIKKSKYFILPNEIFSLGLNSYEIAIYAYLLYCENRQTYECYPSATTIGKHIGLNKKTVLKYVHSLEEKELISIEHSYGLTKAGTYRNGNLIYHIDDIRYAVDRKNRIEKKRIESNRKLKSKLLPRLKDKSFRRRHRFSFNKTDNGISLDITPAKDTINSFSGNIALTPEEFTKI